MSFRFQGRVEKLEIARGHDGLLRGPPDPVLAVAVYVGDATTFRTIGRTLHRFRPRKPFPCDVQGDSAELPSAVVDSGGTFRYVIVAVAIEEDGGEDVQRIYGALEHHRMLSVWCSEREEVEAFALSALPDTPAWSTPSSVDLVIDGASAAQTSRSDKFIGAVCWTLSPRPGVATFPSRPSVYRLPFLSADRKNDWTALLAIAH